MWIILLFSLSLVLTISVVVTRNNRIDRGEYYLLIITATVLLCLRYGQGTDYLAYEDIYREIADGRADRVHGEVGWVLLNELCHRVGISFFQMEAFLSLLEMVCLHRCIRRFSPMLCLSFLLFLPTFWFTYYCSALRQAVVLAIFLGFGIELLVRRHYFLYCLVTGFLMTFHVVAVALLVLPFAIELFPRSRRGYIVLFWLFVLACLSSWVILICFPQISYYTRDGVTFSFKALAMRLILLGFVCTLFMRLSKTEQESRQSVVRVLFIIYLVGIALYLMLFPSAIISQRLTACFKSVEVVLIPMLLISASMGAHCWSNGKPKTQAQILIGVLCILMSAEMIKNVNAEIRHSWYWGTSALSYPYISVFNKATISSERILVGDVLEPESINDKTDEAILDII